VSDLPSVLPGIVFAGALLKNSQKYFLSPDKRRTFGELLAHAQRK
jgi:hypothetical protein